MIDKIKTINKAQQRYRVILPAHGKSTLEESFFCLRGEFFFQFKTKDKKLHTMKAIKLQPARSAMRIDQEFLRIIFRMVNKPIFIRSLVMKNLKSTPMMLGFYTM